MKATGRRDHRLARESVAVQSDHGVEDDEKTPVDDGSAIWFDPLLPALPDQHREKARGRTISSRVIMRSLNGSNTAGTEERDGDERHDHQGAQVGPDRADQGKGTVAAEETGKGDHGDGRRRRREQNKTGPEHFVADHEGAQSDDDVPQDDIAHDDPEQSRKEEGAGPDERPRSRFPSWRGPSPGRGREGPDASSPERPRKREGSRPGRGERSRSGCAGKVSALTSRTIAPVGAREPCEGCGALHFDK